MTVRPVCIAYAHNGFVRAEFADSLFTLLARMQVMSRICLHSGPRIATTRNNIVRGFLEHTGADWLWMLDSDMVFTPDTLDRLLAVGERYPIVGGLCFTRNQDGTVRPCLYRWDRERNLQVVKKYRRRTIEKVDATGAACLLIHRSVLEKMYDPELEPYPWFEDTADAKGGELGEDITFCLRAAEAGFEIVVHTGIRIGHVKDLIVGEEHYR